MEDVSFNEPSFRTTRPAASSKRSLLTRMTIGLGLASDEQSAQRVLLIIAVLAFAVATFFFLHSQPHALSPEEAQKYFPK